MGPPALRWDDVHMDSAVQARRLGGCVWMCVCHTLTVESGWVVRGMSGHVVARQGWAEFTLAFYQTHGNEGYVYMAWWKEAL